MMNYAPSPRARLAAAAELELRRRKHEIELQYAEERALCVESCQYFISKYVFIYDATSSGWLPFDLWPAQADLLTHFAQSRKVIILKARQLGISWLVLAYVLWLMLFHPAATILIFSKRDEEAIELLDFRLKGMHDRVPTWMQADTYTDGKHQWLLANGSRAMAFPTTGGRSYTGTVAVVDEADFVSDLQALVNAVQPTIDAGGQMLLLSTPDKSKPQSLFKRMYRAAKLRLNQYSHVFLSWKARPGRTQAWYEAQAQATLAETGTLDDMHQEYPATDLEALAPRALDKQIPAVWVERCYKEQAPLDVEKGELPGAPSIYGLVIYRVPRFGEQFACGGDPAEGNFNSDDSSFHVLDKNTGEEVARLTGKLVPGVFAARTKTISDYFNRAPILFERNNHGHAVHQWYLDNGFTSRLLNGDDGKLGWNSNALGKTKLYDAAVEAFREGDTTLHSESTYFQLVSIEAGTLRAPEQEHDDEADSFALALVARSRKPATTQQTNYLHDGNKDQEDDYDRWDEQLEG